MKAIERSVMDQELVYLIELAHQELLEWRREPLYERADSHAHRALRALEDFLERAK